MKVSLFLIVKNEESNLLRLQDRLQGHFDEIVIVDTGSTDKSIEVASKFAKVYTHEWKDFSDARNYAMSKCENEWVMWVDADDDAEGLENVRNLVEKAGNIAGYAFKYNYATDKNGNVLSVQWRERLFKKSEFEWKGKIHETAIQKTKNLVVRSDDVVINHLADLESMKESNRRNLDMLLDEVEKDGDKVDPRTLYYIAQTYKGLREWHNACKYYTLYIPKSGWDEEKAQAWHSMADCLRYLSKFQEAIIADHECLKLLPSWPDGFLGLGETYFWMADQLGKSEYWHTAIEWLDAGFSKKMPDTIRVIEPQRYTWMPLLMLAISQLNIGKIDEAYSNYTRALKMSNYDEFVSQHYNLFQEYHEQNEAIKGLKEFVDYTEKLEPKKLAQIKDIIPVSLLEEPRISGIVSKHTPPRIWGKDEIVIFCAFGYEDWADPSVIKGIGGSEEAVIYLSREFVKKGYKVTVYNTCGQFSGKYNGVEYKNIWELNPNDKFNVFISWRNPFSFKSGIQARHKWVWLHDVPLNPEVEYTPEVIDSFDKIIVLSQYHRNLISMVPDEKVLISNNGIVPEQFANLPERKPKTLFWGSSYDRGLECLLNMLPKIDYDTFHVCYGWDTFDKMNKDNVQAQEWKAKMERLMDNPKIIHHGRVSHKKLAQIMGECTVWAYPTEFTEINCITNQKAQCAGLVPVTTNVAALDEFNLQGIKIKSNDIYSNKFKQDEFIKELNNQLKEPKKIDSKKAIEEFSWSKTADQWIKEWS